MGLCCNKSVEQTFKLRSEVKELADDLKNLENKVEQVLDISDFSTEMFSENEKVEIRRLKMMKKDILSKIKEIRVWKAGVLENIFLKKSTGVVFTAFSSWKSRFLKEEVVFEIATTVETEETEEIFDQRLSVRNEPFFSVVYINKVFEEYMFWKFLKDIKESNKIGMKEDWEEFLSKNYKEKKHLIKESILLKAKTCKNDDFLFSLLTRIIGIAGNDMSEHLGKLVKTLINEFNKVKLSEFDKRLNKSCANLWKVEGGAAILVDLFIILVKIVKSKKILYEILSGFSGIGLSKETIISCLIIQLLKHYKITAEDFYDKLTYSQTTKIMCSDIIEGLSLSFSLKISQEDYGLFFKIFHLSKDYFVLKENFLDLIENSEIDYEKIIISKANFLKSFCEVYGKYERASFSQLENFMGRYSSEVISFNQFSNAVRYMNKSCDKCLIESIYYKAVEIENLGGLLSRKTAISILKKYGIGNKELSKFSRISCKVNDMKLEEKDDELEGNIFSSSSGCCLKSVITEVLEEVC